MLSAAAAQPSHSPQHCLHAAAAHLLRCGWCGVRVSGQSGRLSSAVLVERQPAWQYFRLHSHAHAYTHTTRSHEDRGSEAAWFIMKHGKSFVASCHGRDSSRNTAWHEARTVAEETQWVRRRVCSMLGRLLLLDCLSKAGWMRGGPPLRLVLLAAAAADAAGRAVRERGQGREGSSHPPLQCQQQFPRIRIGNRSQHSTAHHSTAQHSAQLHCYTHGPHRAAAHHTTHALHHTQHHIPHTARRRSSPLQPLVRSHTTCSPHPQHQQQRQQQQKCSQRHWSVASGCCGCSG